MKIIQLINVISHYFINTKWLITFMTKERIQQALAASKWKRWRVLSSKDSDAENIMNQRNHGKWIEGPWVFGLICHIDKLRNTHFSSSNEDISQRYSPLSSGN